MILCKIVEGQQYPNICLFAYGRIESPGLAILFQELGEMYWVASFLACCVVTSVFGFEVEDINRESNLVDKVVTDPAQVRIHTAAITMSGIDPGVWYTFLSMSYCPTFQYITTKLCFCRTYHKLRNGL
jgi:hypothetical protein